ncbi:HAD family hydrolase [Falsiroseomonas sp. HC035]|uniref:HAD family hydrolase n=1 Tax=Falsiroseomonas sp. HC035 TaxID=3390999 RepID=UPI003D315E11
MLRPQAVLFDCDGVLADSEALHNRIIAEEVSALGWSMDAAEAERRFIGLSWRNIVPLVEARLGTGSVPSDFVEGVIARVLRALHEQVVPVPGALDAVRAIVAAGIPVAVASNSSRLELTTKLQGLGLTELFRGRTFSYDDVAAPKPAPDMYRAAAASCGADPARCVVVEDSVTGSRAGVAAGCRVLGFAHASNPATLAAVGAEPFHDMRDLPGLLGLAEVAA